MDIYVGKTTVRKDWQGKTILDVIINGRGTTAVVDGGKVIKVNRATVALEKAIPFDEEEVMAEIQKVYDEEIKNEKS